MGSHCQDTIRMTDSMGWSANQSTGSIPTPRASAPNTP